MKRLFVEELLAEKNTVIIDGGDARHLLFATRVRPGEEFLLVDGAKKVFRGAVGNCTRETVEFVLKGEVADGNTEPETEVILAQALLKGDKMDFVVQKAVELGMSAIVPVESRNCIVKYDAKKRQSRLQKWQKVAEEAAKQCGRTAIPEVEEFTALAGLGENYKDYCKIMCYEDEKQDVLKNILKNRGTANKILILIGPEGGFTAEEYSLCKELGFNTISLGRRILRAETAALAAMSIVMYEAGDLGNSL